MKTLALTCCSLLLMTALHAQISINRKKTQPVKVESKPKPVPMVKQQTGMIITGTVVLPTFSNPTYTATMPDGTRVTTTMKTNLGASSSFGGDVRETVYSKTPGPSTSTMDCEYVTKSVSATSDNFMNVEYNSQASTLYPGAIYSFTDFMMGNRGRAFEAGRNPIEIGTDKSGSVSGSTFRVVNDPRQNQINDAINSLRNTFTDGGSSIKYRIYQSDNDAEMSINASAGGNFAGFRASGSYSQNTNESVYYITIDATKAFFTLHTNLPVNGYFSDKSIEQNNSNLIVLKSVVYGCRVLANVKVVATGKKEDLQFQASYGGEGSNAMISGAFNYLKNNRNVESTVNAYVVGGPGGATTFSASNLQNEISEMIARTTHATAQPISYTFSDLNGNVIGIQTATDQYTVPLYTPKSSVFTLASATLQITTGSDPKNQGSNAELVLYSKNINIFESSQNNVEFPTGLGNPIYLNAIKGTENYMTFDAVKGGGYLDIFFTPIQIVLGSDEWNIRGAKITLTFKDQNNAVMGPFTVDYNNLNIWMKYGEQRLRLPFSFNGATFDPGGAFMPR